MISYHKDSNGDGDSYYVDILFAVSSGANSDFMTSPYKQLSAGYVQDATGEMYNNLTRNQMNSFDLLQDRLVLKSIRVKNKEVKSHSLSVLQINSDMGYMPSYTYSKYKNVLDIKSELSSSY